MKMSNIQRETLHQVAEQLLSMANDDKLYFIFIKQLALITEYSRFFDFVGSLSALARDHSLVSSRVRLCMPSF